MLRLNPNLKKKGAPWSEREMAALIRLQHKCGNSWAKISRKMTNCGRSHNDLKNKVRVGEISVALTYYYIVC